MPLAPNMPQLSLHLLESVDEVGAFLRFLGQPRQLLGVDTETTGLSIVKDRVRLFQFGDENEAWALDFDEWRGLVRHVLSTYDRPIVLQNSPFDAGMSRIAGLPFPWEHTHDTHPMLFLYDSLGPQQLKPAGRLFLGAWAGVGEKELKQAMKKNKWTWATVPTNFPLYWGYACMDTCITVRLALKLWPLIQQWRNAYDLEMATRRISNDIEVRGVRCDVDYVAGKSAELHTLLDEQVAELPCNPDSPLDVGRALIEDGSTLTEKTEEGQFVVAKHVLLALDTPLANAILRYRKDKKVVSSWLDGMLRNEHFGRLHPQIKSLEAITGRMSISGSALQTLPKKPIVRDAIIPEDGHQLVTVDYDNQELRMAAHYSNDTNLIRAFAQGLDAHMEVARYIYGEEAADEERQKAKIARYSTMYGAQADTLSNTLGINMMEANRIVTGLAQANPGLPILMEKVINQVRRRAKDENRSSGYVVALDGRHLRVDANKAYAGLDYLIQGSCAVVLKQAMVDLDAAGLGEAMRIPMHDEMVFSVPDEDVAEALPMIEECMTRTDFRVPLTVDSTVVARWGDKYRKD